MISDKNKLILLLVAAFALRGVGVNYGAYHPDEHLVINHAMAFGTGDFNPHMFYFPSFFLYLVFLVYGLFYLLGHVAGSFPTPDSFLLLFLDSPQVFYTLARFVGVVFGTFSVLAIYALGKEYRNARTGFLAALFLALNFLHVRDSHFAVMDITLTFFCLVSFYELFRFWNTGEKKFFAVGVFAAGMASAVKYNAFVLALPIAMIYFYEKIERRGGFKPKEFLRVCRDALGWGALMFLGFFMFSP